MWYRNPGWRGPKVKKSVLKISTTPNCWQIELLFFVVAVMIYWLSYKIGVAFTVCLYRRGKNNNQSSENARDFVPLELLIRYRWPITSWTSTVCQFLVELFLTYIQWFGKIELRINGIWVGSSHPVHFFLQFRVDLDPDENIIIREQKIVLCLRELGCGTGARN